MSEDNVELDETGKAVLDDIYCQADPRAYFTLLKPLDYQIPKHGQIYFSRLVDKLSGIRNVERIRVVDLGCSYGINSALLKLPIAYDRLVANYADPKFVQLSRRQLLERDRALFSGQYANGPHITGVDISLPALQYAIDAGYLNASIGADLEVSELSPRDESLLAGTDLIISTGCIGYVGATSIQRLLTGIGEGRPWSAHFVLRMFQFDQIAAIFAERGYQTIALPGLFRQRKFMSDAEQEEILQELSSQGIETAGFEDDGYFYAQLHLSIPDEDLVHIQDLIDIWCRDEVG